MRERMVVKAHEVQLGDLLPGGMIVCDISHGPLDHQIRFRNADETASADYYEQTEIRIERPYCIVKVPLGALKAAEKVLAEQQENCGGGEDTIYYEPLREIRAALRNAEFLS